MNISDNKNLILLSEHELENVSGGGVKDHFKQIMKGATERKGPISVLYNLESTDSVLDAVEQLTGNVVGNLIYCLEFFGIYKLCEYVYKKVKK